MTDKRLAAIADPAIAGRMVRTPKFDAKWQRKQRFSRIWRSLRVWLVLAALLALGWWMADGPTWNLGFGAEWDQQSALFTICGRRPSKTCVVDGDTIMIGQRRIRLTGFDTPELDGKCEAERLLAIQAREVLQGWLNQSDFELDGGTQAPRDQYGRELRAARRVTAGREEWLADFMVKRGLARRSSLDRDWCA